MPFEPPVTGSLAQVLRMPSTGPIPEPMTIFKCPLCQVMVGREAIATHLRTVHQFDRPEKLDLVPSRDVLPGRLTCAHCKATFNVEFELRTHFTKASCPVKLCQLASDLHFGPVTAPATMPISDSDLVTLDPLPVPARTTFVRYGLIRHESNGPEVESVLNLLTPCSSPFMHTVPFWPEVRLAWHALPQVCLDLTWICPVVHQLCHMMPLPWAWNSDPTDLPVFVAHVIPETWLQQAEHLVNILFHIEHTLAQNIYLDPSLTIQHIREHERRRSELCRFDGTLWGTLWQKAEDRLCWIVRSPTWTAPLQQILQLLGLYGRPDDDAGTSLFEAGRHVECHIHGQIFHRIPAMWQGKYHAIDIANLQRLASETPERWSDPASSPTPVPHSHRRALEAGPRSMHQTTC